MGLFGHLAYVLIMGVAAAAFLAAMISGFLGIGSHRIASTVIGTAAGILVLLVVPLTGGVAAMIAAAVVSLVASIALDKLW